MLTRERKSDRRLRAIKQGAMARKLGLSRRTCPYKDSPWGLGGFWLMGYDDEAQSENSMPVQNP